MLNIQDILVGRTQHKNRWTKTPGTIFRGNSQPFLPPELGKIGDIPRGTLQLNDMQSRIGPVSKIDEPTVIDLYIVGLDCNFPISWDRFLGCFGNIESDLLGVGRISHVECPDSRIEI